MKNYIINGQKIEIAEETKMQVEGITGDVYPLGNNRVLKVLNGEQEDLDETTAKYLTHQSASRILLPTDIAYDKRGNYRGYVLPSGIKKQNGQSIIYARKGTFVRDVIALEQDITKLTGAKVSLNYISPDYTLFNGKLYLTDPKKFRLQLNADTEKLGLLNNDQLHSLLIELISRGLRADDEFNPDFINQIEELLGLRDYNESPSTFFNDLLPDNKTVHQFVKTLRY